MVSASDGDARIDRSQLMSEMPWAFEALARRLPDSPIMVLELGASSDLPLPREAGRVVVHSQPSLAEPIGSIHAPGCLFDGTPTYKNAFVQGDIEDSRVLRGALTLIDPGPTMLVAIDSLDPLSQLEAFELIDHVIWDLGLVGALVKSRHDLTFQFARDRFGAGRVAQIVDYTPNREPDRWYLYAKP